ncbi:MMPL family transporter [Shewanella sp. WXL01]|uniref:MMPL family transporter n=1 Tax=Shewanella sp. WXL01 TaxID=2709721 RepID=UPI0014382B9E|nr:MMPL family transporter [Shewanella sp. WXL01]NKF49962.1 MMPL family transporter [Shewanella sp. WXL01]
MKSDRQTQSRNHADNAQPASNKPRYAMWLWLVCQLGLCILLVTQVINGLRPNNDFLALLPKDEQRPWVQQTIEAAAGSLEQRMVFVIKADSKAQALDAAQNWQQTLTGLEHVELITPEQSQRTYYQGLFPYRGQLLDADAKNWLEQQQADKLTTRVLTQLYNPFAGVTAGELEQDPWLLFRHYMQQGFADNQFELVDNLLYLSQTADNDNAEQQAHYTLIQAKLNVGAYSQAAQQTIDAINTHAEQLQSKHLQAGQSIDIWRQGVAFYVVEAASSAKSEVSIIGGGSLLGVILLILLVFKSVRPLLMCLTSISIGVISAAGITVLLFGEIHSFTLVIGASLIGVSVDYAFHYLSCRACSSHWHSVKAAAHLRPVLLLGLISSVLAYSALLWANFPGLNQVAVFSSAGLIASLITVLILYPQLSQASAKHKPIKLANGLLNLVQGYQQSKVAWAVITLMTLGSVVGISKLNFDDDIRLLQSAPQWLKQQEQQIAELTGVSQSQQWLVLNGESQAQLRQAEQTLAPKLNALKQQGIISDFSGVYQLLPGEAELKHNHQLIDKLYREQASALTAQIGLQPNAYAPYQALDWHALAELAPHTPYLWGELANGRAYSVITLSGVTDVAPLVKLTTLANKASLANRDSIRSGSALTLAYVSRADEISALLGDYRKFTLYMLAIAYGLVLLLLTMRYSFKDAICVLAAPLLAGIFALALPGLFSMPANLFNVVALLLIFGIGIDYSLFLRFHLNQAHATLAVLLAGITTLLSFGLMGLSSNHAIASFGLTIAGGILASWVLAPVFSQYLHTRHQAVQNRIGGNQ